MSHPVIPHQELVASSSLFPDLIRVSGGFGQISGAGQFMVRTIIAGTTTAVTLGLSGALVGALFAGTAALPFLLSSCAGFCLGATAFYRDAARRSEIAFVKFPDLMLLHLNASFPSHEWRRSELSIQKFRGDWTLRSMLIASWMGAQSSLQVRCDFRRGSKSMLMLIGR